MSTLFHAVTEAPVPLPSIAPSHVITADPEPLVRDLATQFHQRGLRYGGGAKSYFAFGPIEHALAMHLFSGLRKVAPMAEYQYAKLVAHEPGVDFLATVAMCAGEVSRRSSPPPHV